MYTKYNHIDPITPYPRQHLNFEKSKLFRMYLLQINYWQNEI